MWMYFCSVAGWSAACGGGCGCSLGDNDTTQPLFLKLHLFSPYSDYGCRPQRQPGYHAPAIFDWRAVLGPRSEAPEGCLSEVSGPTYGMAGVDVREGDAGEMDGICGSVHPIQPLKPTRHRTDTASTVLVDMGSQSARLLLLAMQGLYEPVVWGLRLERLHSGSASAATAVDDARSLAFGRADHCLGHHLLMDPTFHPISILGPAYPERTGPKRRLDFLLPRIPSRVAYCMLTDPLIHAGVRRVCGEPNRASGRDWVLHSMSGPPRRNVQSCGAAINVSIHSAWRTLTNPKAGRR